MSFLDIMQILIFVVGIIACSLAIYFLILFRHTTENDGLVVAMKTFLIEQFISAMSTLYFSFNALYSSITGLPKENWNNVTPEISTILRIAIFLAMILSTGKLCYEIKKIQQEKLNQKDKNET